MLINLRNALMSRAGASPRPVEYIESDGNQWFDIEIPYGSNTGFYMDYMPTQSTVSTAFFGATRTGTDYSTDFKLMIVGNGRQRYDRYDRSSAQLDVYASNRQNFTFNPRGAVSSTPYRYYSSVVGRLAQYDTWYSSAYQSSRSLLGFFHSVVNTSTITLTGTPMRLYGFELREYSSSTAYTTTLKLTPVSVGGVGAMLDEISGVLHFNQGTGDFVLGQDK